MGASFIVWQDNVPGTEFIENIATFVKNMALFEKSCHKAVVTTSELELGNRQR